MATHLYIPDVQVQEGVPLDHLHAVGNLIVRRKPDVIICAGDFADMPSLSSYDIGKKSFEGRRYQKDVAASRQAMEVMLAPMKEYNAHCQRIKHRQYRPEMILTLGNHENRISRVVESDARLDGTIGIADLGYEEFGWRVIPFMQPVIVDGVAYCHFFYNKLTGRPHPNARTTLLREHMSCVQGHQQKLEIDIQYRGDGKRMTSITAGAYYLHDEEYKGASGNVHWRGIVLLHDVQDGDFDVETISIDRMIREYA